MSSTADSAGADVLVVCGPTAAGKSGVALALAERFPITIISADSRAVYRGFDVGTAKPTMAEQQRVPHRGIDVAEPTERYSAATWAALAECSIDEARTAGRIPIVVGGTGFYLRALFEPLFVAPELDPERRRALEELLAPIPVPELMRWTAALDPPRSHLGRTQLLRSIETALLTGERLSDLHRTRARPPRRTARYLLVDPGQLLGDRIAARYDAIQPAWLEEVRRLAATVPADAPAWHATGYRTLRQLADGMVDAATVRQRVIIETRQYAKRQRTWFRHQLPADRVTRLDPTTPGWAAHAERWLRGETEERR